MNAPTVDAMKMATVSRNLNIMVVQTFLDITKVCWKQKGDYNAARKRQLRHCLRRDEEVNESCDERVADVTPRH